MLQQTQVATVIPYFGRFLAAFPTVQALADADEQQVLRLWQGLGYYRRARNLHAAAKAIVERFAGRVPHTVEDLLSLPGVGRYTAGAVASIAFGRCAPIVDGNVVRVLSRWFLIADPVDATPTKGRLWSLAEELVQGEHPGDFNQAMMELGATVCTPRDPKCLFCPVADLCEAHRAGRQHDVPVAGKRAARLAVMHEVLAIRQPRTGKYLFERRPETGLWSNMWQLPTRELATKRGVATAQHTQERCAVAPSLIEWGEARFGLKVGGIRRVGTLAHATTHRDIAFTIDAADAAAGRLKRGAGEWRSLDDLDDLPLPKPQLRAVALLRQPLKSEP